MIEETTAETTGEMIADGETDLIEEGITEMTDETDTEEEMVGVEIETEMIGEETVETIERDAHREKIKRMKKRINRKIKSMYTMIRKKNLIKVLNPCISLITFARLSFLELCRLCNDHFNEAK